MSINIFVTISKGHDAQKAGHSLDLRDLAKELLPFDFVVLHFFCIHLKSINVCVLSTKYPTFIDNLNIVLF